MPAVISSQNATKLNGFHKLKQSEQLSSSSSLSANDDSDNIKMKLASKKLNLIEQEHKQFNDGALHHQKSQQEAEVFHDTRPMGAHSSSRSNDQDDEPIIIFDTQSNTSIAQTAKDQFAAALLRLQSSLDDSSSRLNAIESKVDDIVRQQRQQTTRTNQGSAAAAKKSSWLSFAADTRYSTFLYLSWPVLVFVAMRALEKRALLKRLD